MCDSWQVTSQLTTIWFFLAKSKYTPLFKTNVLGSHITRMIKIPLLFRLWSFIIVTINDSMSDDSLRLFALPSNYPSSVRCICALWFYFRKKKKTYYKHCSTSKLEISVRCIDISWVILSQLIDEKAMIRNRYNRFPHTSPDTTLNSIYIWARIWEKGPLGIKSIIYNCKIFPAFI